MSTLSPYLFLFCSFAGQDSELEFLVSAHESAVGMIHSVYMEIECSETWRNGERHAKPKRKASWVWAKEGEKERLRYKYHSGKKDFRGRAKDAGDLLLDGQTERGMHNWDPDHPFALTDGDQGPLNAWIRPRSNLLPTPFLNAAGQFALLEVQPTHSYPPRSLRQFLDAARGHVAVAHDDQRGVWKIQIASPQLPPASGRVTFAEIDLLESANYLVNRTRFGLSHSPSSSKTEMIVEKQVVEFVPARNGVTIPKRVRAILRGPKGTSEGQTIEELEASAVVVNSKLPAAAFNFTFPENAIVREFPAVNNRVTARVWGPDNKPVRQIHGPEDIVSPLRSPLGQPSPTWTNWIGVGVLGLAAAALGVAVYRRFRSWRIGEA